jgi:hypothetical protein
MFQASLLQPGIARARTKLLRMGAMQHTADLARMCGQQSRFDAPDPKSTIRIAESGRPISDNDACVDWNQLGHSVRPRYFARVRPVQH